ncbi:MAG TPA: Nudix family hydrolase [Casimicrobiaceae bacterium]|nr:Nudix family hydrolase [Casimicrobiaceae bacterium]
MTIVRVAAAVITRPDGCVLLAQRPIGKPYAGYWEFPGGKLEPGESAVDALARELKEELGITVTHAAPWIAQEFVYPHAHVELDFFRVLGWIGEPFGHDGQSFAWQKPGAFDVAPLLPANTRVLTALTLPGVCGVTNAGDIGEEEFLARAEHALIAGLRLIQLREKDWPAARRDAFAARLLPLAARFGARVLLNGSVEDARRGGFAGVHWPAATLTAARSRPRDLLVAASCHSRDELAHAATLDVDFAFVGPVQPTATHPGAPTLDWKGFATCIEATRVPVYAIGGLTRDDLAIAIDHGAHGIALRRSAWPAN